MSARCTRWSGTYKRSKPSHSGRLQARSSGSCRFGFRWLGHFSAGVMSKPAAWRRGSTCWRSSAISCRLAHLLYWLPTYLCWLAEAYVRADKPTEARSCLEQARNVTGQGGNYWYDVECLRIEGRLAAHPRINDASKAEQCFEQALALARQRGQRGFALRAALGLADHLAGNGRPDRARELLQDELQFFSDQPDRGDRVDAKALLCSLQGASPGRKSNS